MLLKTICERKYIEENTMKNPTLVDIFYIEILIFLLQNAINTL
jgi:hypothetical protein